MASHHLSHSLFFHGPLCSVNFCYLQLHVHTQKTALENVYLFAFINDYVNDECEQACV